MDSPDPPSPEMIREHLEQVLDDSPFSRSPRLAAFLCFVVNEALAGRGSSLKQYAIGVGAFGRDASFDPEQDPVVRIQAGRVRRALDRYYRDEGRAAVMRITIPTGTYKPSFAWTIRSAVRTRSDVPPAIAVQPLRNATGDASLDYYAIGFSEELSLAVTRTSVLRVMSDDHGSSRDRLVAKEDSCVAYAVTGTLHEKSDDRLRLTVKLHDTASREQLWIDVFDREIGPTNSELIRVQAEIVARVASATVDLNGAVSRAIVESARVQPEVRLAAYEALYLGHQYDYTLSPRDFQVARQALEQAVQNEPNFAPAWAALAQIYLDAEAFVHADIENAIERGCDCARRAFSIAPGRQEAQYAAAYAALVRGECSEVIRHADQIFATNPYAAHMTGASGWFLCMVGEYERGLRRIDEAQNLNPGSAIWFEHARFIHAYDRGQYSEALGAVRRFELPDVFWTPLALAVCHAKLGNGAEAHREYRKLIDLLPDFPKTARYRIGLLVQQDSVVDSLIQGLIEAGMPNEEGYPSARLA